MPADARALRAQGLPSRRCADLPEARELHRERRWGDNGGLPRADGRGAPARSRGVRHRPRARGRAARGGVALPCGWSGDGCDAGQRAGSARAFATCASRSRVRPPLRDMASGGRAEHGSRPRARAASVVVPFPRRESGGRLDSSGSSPPAARSCSPSRFSRVPCLPWLAARETGMFAVRSSTSKAPHRRSLGRAHDARRRHGTSLLKLDAAPPSAASRRSPRFSRRRFDRAFPHTLRIIVVPERAVAIVRQGPDSWLVSARGRVIAGIERGTTAAAARGSGSSATFELEVAAIIGRRSDGARHRRRSLGRRALPRACRLASRPGPTNLRWRCAPACCCASASRPTSASSWRSPPVSSRCSPPDTVYLDVSVPDRPVAG